MAESTELPEKYKKFFDFLKIDPEAEDLKQTFFDAGYVHKDIVPDRDDIIDPIFAKTYAVINRKLKQKFRDYVDLEGEIFKNEDGSERPPVEVIEAITEKITPKLTGDNDEVKRLQKELEDAKKSKGNSKEIEDLTAQLEKAHTERDEYKTLLDGQTEQFNQFKENIVQQQFEQKRDQYVNESMEVVKVKPGTPKVALIGLRSEALAEYQLTQEDDGKIAVRGKDGKRIKHPEHANQFAELSDILIEKAKKEGIYDENPHSGKPAERRTTEPPQHPNNNGKPARTINYGANVHKERFDG